MKVTLIPSLEPSLPSSAGVSITPVPEDAACTPVNQVLNLLEDANATLLRKGRFAIQVDIDPEHLSGVLESLQGWDAEPEQVSSNVSAYEGMLHRFSSEK